MRKLKLKKDEGPAQSHRVILARAGIQAKHHLAPKSHMLMQQFSDLALDKSLFIQPVNPEQPICASHWSRRCRFSHEKKKKAYILKDRDSQNIKWLTDGLKNKESQLFVPKIMRLQVRGLGYEVYLFRKDPWQHFGTQFWLHSPVSENADSQTCVTSLWLC